jgi:hypothetical protein
LPARQYDEGVSRRQSKERFPWALLVLLLGIVYGLWIWPAQIGPQSVRVEFSKSVEESRMPAE